MDSIEACGNTYIRPVIHDDLDRILFDPRHRDTFQLADIHKHLCRASLLVAILNQSHATGQQFTNEGNDVIGRGIRGPVNNGIKARQLHHARDRAGAMNRSMNFVSKRPARKSASFMIR